MTHPAPFPSNQSHLRLTPEKVFELWLADYYTPKGYLYHLVLAHRKAGWWWRIKNVSEFCRKWKINRRTFYRVKAALIGEGLFEESIIGAVDIRIPAPKKSQPKGFGHSDTGVSDGSHPVSDEDTGVSDGSQSSPEPLATQALPDPTSSLQISDQLHTEEECVAVETFVLEESKQKTPPTNQPTEEIKKPNIQASSKKEITPPAAQRAKKLGVNVSDRVLLEAIAKWPTRLSTGLDCLEEKQPTVKHPTRFLQKAIENNWQPERRRSAPTGFGEWFAEARRRGLAIASEMKGDVLHIFTTDHHWLPFEQLRKMTWDELTARMKPITTNAINVQATPISGV